MAGRRHVLVAVVVAVLAGGCGDDDTESSPAAVETPPAVAAPPTETAPTPSGDTSTTTTTASSPSARERLERRLSVASGERTIAVERDDLVIIADPSDPDPSDIAVKSIIRDYLRSGYSRPLRIQFDGPSYELSREHLADFEEEDAAGVVDVRRYIALP